MGIVWPFLRYICFCFFRGKQRNFKHGLKRALRRKMDLRVSKSDQLIEEDPYLLLGYGMNSYFQIMLNLMCMMLIASLFAVPLMMRFAEFDALRTPLSLQIGFQVYSIGNMGGSESLCEVARIIDPRSQIQLQCAAGVISTSAIAENTDSPIFQAGVIPQNAESFGWCSSTAFQDPAKCSSFLKVDALKDKIDTTCNGKKSCSISNLKSYMPAAIQI